MHSNNPIKSNERSKFFVAKSIACKITSMLDELSADNVTGLKNGTIAPYFSAIVAYNLLSVETHIFSFFFTIPKINSIVFAINGFPLNGIIFLFGIDFDPLLAGINHKTLS